MAGRTLGMIAVMAVMAAMAGLAACASPDSPETQVRAVLAAAEQAVEARDVSAVMERVAPDYADADGRQTAELARTLRGYFIANQSIHLLTRVEALEFPATDVAEAELTVAMVGREAEAASAWDLAADVHSLKVTLMEQGGEWRVTRVDRQGPMR